jgi:Trk K+ transport system NAD-binding subunit
MGIVAALGNTVQNIIIATAIVNFPLYARVARAEANVRRNAGFVQAARLSGNGEFRILLHLLRPAFAADMAIEADHLLAKTPQRMTRPPKADSLARMLSLLYVPARWRMMRRSCSA